MLTHLLGSLQFAFVLKFHIPLPSISGVSSMKQTYNNDRAFLQDPVTRPKSLLNDDLASAVESERGAKAITASCKADI